MRRSGVLLPVTSLPSRFGIGTFSKEAYAFVDFLKEAGQKLWQILPFGTHRIWGIPPIRHFLPLRAIPT